MALQLRSGPAVEPLDLNEIKSFMRIDGTDEDMLIASLLTAARIYLETSLGHILIHETWSWYLDRWPKGESLSLPLGPVSSINSITLHHDTGAEIISSAIYAVDLVSHPARLYLKSGQGWPPSDVKPNAIEINFIAGYGTDRTDVPQDLKQALLMIIAHWYERREPVSSGERLVEVPSAAQAIMAHYRRPSLW